jgi:hypothetical protein
MCQRYCRCYRRPPSYDVVIVLAIMFVIYGLVKLVSSVF